MKRSRHNLIVLIAVAVITAAGCRSSDVPSSVLQTREVQDDLNRVVRVPQKIERAISLAPSLTEMIFAVGAGGRLVGVTTYCDYPDEAASIPKIGDTQTPNLERIIALKPQIVFCVDRFAARGFHQNVRGAGNRGICFES